MSKKRKFCGNQYTQEESTEYSSATVEKLAYTNDEEFLVENTHGYRIIEFFSVFTAISNLGICKDCKTGIKFDGSSPAGLGFKIALTCQCDQIYVKILFFTISKKFETEKKGK